MTSSSLPPQPLLGDIVRTTLVIWVGLHIASAIGGGGVAGNPLVPAPAVEAILLALVVVFSHLDRSSRGLTLFLANLGFSPVRVGLLVLAVAGGAELALRFLVGMVT